MAIINLNVKNVHCAEPDVLLMQYTTPTAVQSSPVNGVRKTERSDLRKWTQVPQSRKIERRRREKLVLRWQTGGEHFTATQ